MDIQIDNIRIYQNMHGLFCERYGSRILRHSYYYTILLFQNICVYTRATFGFCGILYALQEMFLGISILGINLSDNSSFYFEKYHNFGLKWRILYIRRIALSIFLIYILDSFKAAKNSLSWKIHVDSREVFDSKFLLIREIFLNNFSEFPNPENVWPPWERMYLIASSIVQKYW